LVRIRRVIDSNDRMMVSTCFPAGVAAGGRSYCGHL
jgi:hypothetical protein